MADVFYSKKDKNLKENNDNKPVLNLCIELIAPSAVNPPKM